MLFYRKIVFFGNFSKEKNCQNAFLLYTHKLYKDCPMAPAVWAHFLKLKGCQWINHGRGQQNGYESHLPPHIITDETATSARAKNGAHNHSPNTEKLLNQNDATPNADIASADTHFPFAEIPPNPHQPTEIRNLTRETLKILFFTLLPIKLSNFFLL